MDQRYIIYCRKSSESEKRQVLSIESQVKELKELTERLKLPVSELLTKSQSANYPGRPVFNSVRRKVSMSQPTTTARRGVPTGDLGRNPFASKIWRNRFLNILSASMFPNRFLTYGLNMLKSLPMQR